MNYLIDHTNLNNTATFEDIEKLCKEAIEYNFATVCVHPFYVSIVKEYLKKTNIGVTTVVGFPLGMNTTQVKVYEAIDAAENGADEIDMVINIGAVKNKDYDYIKQEIEEVRDAIGAKILKVIIESSKLEKEEIIKMTEICNQTFVQFIKTSTGFDGCKATLEAVNLINEHKLDVLEIKASGGIKTASDCEAFVQAGATRIGTSNGINIIKGDE